MKINREYTPKPWETKPDCYYIIAPNAPIPEDEKGQDRHHYETSQFGGMMLCESVMSEADRRLISAAPDLVDALIGIARQKAFDSKNYSLGTTKAVEYADTNWHLHLDTKSRTALTKAGVIQ